MIADNKKASVKKSAHQNTLRNQSQAMTHHDSSFSNRSKVQKHCEYLIAPSVQDALIVETLSEDELRDLIECKLSNAKNMSLLIKDLKLMKKECLET